MKGTNAWCKRKVKRKGIKGAKAEYYMHQGFKIDNGCEEAWRTQRHSKLDFWIPNNHE